WPWPISCPPPPWGSPASGGRCPSAGCWPTPPAWATTSPAGKSCSPGRTEKVPSSRHARMDGTHTGKFGAESVRAALRRVRGSAPNFVPRGIPGGRNFCPATAGRNGFPLERVVFRHAENSCLAGGMVVYFGQDSGVHTGHAVFLL